MIKNIILQNMVQQYGVDMEDDKVVAANRTCLTFQRSEHHKTFSKNWNDLENESRQFFTILTWMRGGATGERKT